MDVFQSRKGSASMNKFGRFAAACAAVALGLGVSGSLTAAETTVRRAVAATTPGKHVDIGYFQSDDPGLMLLVR